MVELTVTSPVLTNEEAVRFLRLDTDYNETALTPAGATTLKGFRSTGHE